MNRTLSPRLDLVEQVPKPHGMDWVSSLRAPQIAQLAAEHGPFQPTLFDERNLIELTSEHFPGERLVVCRNLALAEERARKRGELLAATEADLARIAAATQRARNPLRSEQAIALRVGRVIGHFPMAKHLELTITDTSLTSRRRHEAITQEAALDGLFRFSGTWPPNGGATRGCVVKHFRQAMASSCWPNDYVSIICLASADIGKRTNWMKNPRRSLSATRSESH